MEKPDSLPAEIRNALRGAIEPLTSAMLFDLCKLAADTTAVASAMHAELRAGRVERRGEHGRYAYTITAAGRDFDSGRTAPRKAPAARATRDVEPVPTAANPAAPQPPQYDPASVAFPPGWTGPHSTVTADLAARLAAAVVMYWMGPLAAMPSELRNLVDTGLSLRAPA